MTPDIPTSNLVEPILTTFTAAPDELLIVDPPRAVLTALVRARFEDAQLPDLDLVATEQKLKATFADFETASKAATSIENGLCVVRYMLNASVWTVGFLFLGLVEYTVRTGWKRFPAVPSPISLISIPALRKQAVGITTVGGALHAVVMLWFSLRVGLTVSGDLGWLMYISSTLGVWILAAVPLYLLVRHLVVAPATVLTASILLDVRAEFTASPDDPHALYFDAWFLYLGLPSLWQESRSGFAGCR